MKQKFLLFLMLLTAALTANASIYDFEVDGIYYHIGGNNNVTVIYKTLGQGDYSGDLVIPETVTYDGVTYTVSAINYRAFDGSTNLTSVSLPSTITSIGSDAFWGCTALSSITVDSSNPKYDSRDNCNAVIETSSNKLIAGCKNTIIPNSVTIIGEKAFFRSGLTNIFIPSSVTSIGKRAFSSCDDLESINVDSENPIFDSRDYCNAIIETSSNKLFAGCMNTIIPNTVTYINEDAFYGCHGLNNMTIPNSVTYISRYAFHSCHDLTNITIGNSVTTIGEDAFSYSGLQEVTIPSSVKYIGKYAFSSCYNLTSVTLPNAISSLGECVFDGCSSLTSVTMPNYLSKISSYMFRGCTSLTSISIPSNVTFIGNSAFECCESLTSITIPSSVISIGEWAFGHCSGLKNVTIGNSVETIDGFAFEYCTSLTSILIPNSVTTINSTAFGGCSGLTSIVVESDNPTYDSRNNCNAIIETQSNSLIIGCQYTCIPNSVTSICSGAFTCCYGLTKVTIPSSVNYIGEYAFNNCPNIISITCFAITPPDAYCIAIDYENMYDEDYISIYEQATLFVPNESLEAYRTHDEWGNFSRIVPFIGAGPGDTNGDGVINVADVTDLIDVLLCGGELPAYCDMNGDGNINVADMTSLIDMLLSSD